MERASVSSGLVNWPALSADCDDLYTEAVPIGARPKACWQRETAAYRYIGSKGHAIDLSLHVGLGDHYNIRPSANFVRWSARRGADILLRGVWGKPLSPTWAAAEPAEEARAVPLRNNLLHRCGGDLLTEIWREETFLAREAIMGCPMNGGRLATAQGMARSCERRFAR
jgi:hypothetical protein